MRPELAGPPSHGHHTGLALQRTARPCPLSCWLASHTIVVQVCGGVAGCHETGHALEGSHDLFDIIIVFGVPFDDKASKSQVKLFVLDDSFIYTHHVGKLVASTAVHDPFEGARGSCLRHIPRCNRGQPGSVQALPKTTTPRPRTNA